MSNRAQSTIHHIEHAPSNICVIWAASAAVVSLIIDDDDDDKKDKHQAVSPARIDQLEK